MKTPPLLIPTKKRALANVVRGGQLQTSVASVAVVETPVVVGRSAASDLTLDDEEVSALHCELPVIRHRNPWRRPRAR